MSELLWKCFCQRTGKLAETVSDDEMHVDSSDSCINQQLFRDWYYKTPCVPVDFDSISEALLHCPSGSTVTLLSGIYPERLRISRPVTLRSAVPTSTAAIVWQSPALNECCISIDQGSGAVTLENIEVLHFTGGADIWNGNCAILACGNNIHLRLTRCAIQSDSGRGLVCAGGAAVELIQTTIHHCSATGLYIGDVGTTSTIHQCNIVCNGFGTRRTVLSQLPAVARSNDSDEDASYAEEDGLFDPSSIFRPAVIPGHSGLYVERAKVDISDCLIGGNCLTGLSVVRRGHVVIKNCDVTANGHLPIMVQDAYDEPLQSLAGGLIQRDNNFSSIRRTASTEQSGDEEGGSNNRDAVVAAGGRVRQTPFLHAILQFTTWSELEGRYPQV